MIWFFVSFYTCFSLRSFTAVWVTASLLKSPIIVADINSNVTGWYRFFLWSLIHPDSFWSLWWSFQVHHLQLVSPLPSYFTDFSALLQYPSCRLFLRLLSFSICGLLEEKLLINSISGFLNVIDRSIGLWNNGTFIIIKFYYHHFAPSGSFTPALADGILMESDW